MAVHQGGPQSGHAAHIVPAGQAALAPAAPDTAPGGAGNAPYVVAVAAGNRAVILAVSDSPQIHQAHNAAGVVLFPSDCSRIDAGVNDGLGLIPEVQRAVALLNQVVLRVKVVLDGHGAHDPGHIDVALHRSVVPGIGQIPRICGLGRFVRHIFKAILNLLARTIQNIPQQVGNDAELFNDGVQIIQQDVRAAGHGLLQGIPVVKKIGKDVSQGISLLLDLAADGLNGDGGHLGQLVQYIGKVVADARGQRRQFLYGISGLPQFIHGIPGLLQQFPQLADGVLAVVHTAGQRPKGGRQIITGGLGLPAGSIQLIGIDRGRHQFPRGCGDLLRGYFCVLQAGTDGCQFGSERLDNCLGSLCSGQCREGVLNLRGSQFCGGDGGIQIVQLRLQILPCVGRAQILQNVIHFRLCVRKLLGRGLQSFIGGG